MTDDFLLSRDKTERHLWTIHLQWMYKQSKGWCRPRDGTLLTFAFGGHIFVIESLAS